MAAGTTWWDKHSDRLAEWKVWRHLFTCHLSLPAPVRPQGPRLYGLPAHHHPNMNNPLLPQLKASKQPTPYHNSTGLSFQILPCTHFETRTFLNFAVQLISAPNCGFLHKLIERPNHYPPVHHHHLHGSSFSNSHHRSRTLAHNVVPRAISHHGPDSRHEKGQQT